MKKHTLPAKRPNQLNLKIKNAGQVKTPSELRRLRYSRSEENLAELSTRSVPHRKASTPTHDHTTLSESPNISCITNNTKTKAGGKYVPTGKMAASISKTATTEDADLREQLDLEYNRYIEALFRKNLLEAKASELENNLSTLQKRITDNEKILRQTTERLKNVQFNKEVDQLYALHKPNYAKALETVNSTDCEKQLSELSLRLEKTQNQLKVKNIALSEGGVAQLMEIVSETQEAIEKLKSGHDTETPSVLREIKAVNEAAVEALDRCKGNLHSAENLLLARGALQICSRRKKEDQGK